MTAPPDTSTFVNGGLFWREDEALKAWIKRANVVTYDATSPAGGRALPVYFRNAEVEVRRREFPYILLDRVGWGREVDREMRGIFRLNESDPYLPDGTGPGANYHAQDLPLPIMIQYQVQAWTRFKLQMLWVENQMMRVLPLRFGAIEMANSSHARDDNTVRRMDFLGVVPQEIPDTENPGKRLFGRTWTVGISSEILPSDLAAYTTPKVEEIIIDPSNRPGYSSLT